MLKWDQRGRAYLVPKVQKVEQKGVSLLFKFKFRRGETNGRFS